MNTEKIKSDWCRINALQRILRIIHQLYMSIFAIRILDNGPVIILVILISRLGNFITFIPIKTIKNQTYDSYIYYTNQRNKHLLILTIR